MKFKKGDKIRMKEFPEQTGTIIVARKEMLWCKLENYKGSVPFCKPIEAELINK